MKQKNDIVRRDPFDAVSPFGLTFGRLFDEMYGRGTDGAERAIAPALDVFEDESSFTVAAEMPGLKKEDVKVTFEDGVLTIAGEKKFEEASREKSWHRMERRYGAFYRAVTLPAGVTTESAKAEFADGVLKVTLQKREDVKPRSIAVQ